MVYDRDEIVKRALESKTNVPGTCQLWTRTIIGVDSAGDQDGDGDADAVDGWKSEPYSAKHADDRSVPKGYPVAFRGGSNGYGHRAISLGHGLIRSTDMSDDGSSYQAGNVGTSTIAKIEAAMGIQYLGWSETMSGVKIPDPPPPTRGENVDHAIEDLKDAKSKKDTPRRRLIDRALELLRRIKKH
jgi:hypothetical protein